jgi:hypothetical protein
MTTVRRMVGTVLACLVLAGCQSAETPRDPVTSKVENAAPRTDREPIEKRFPELGAFTEVHWLGGTLGDDRAPGSSTYFIEAAVSLRPDEAATLRQRYGPAPSAGPQPPGRLSGYLGGTGWTASPELDRAMGLDQWQVHVFVRPDAPVAYLSATGGN